ncbi:ectonucleotide pyrophosphatase/phosphodiesterase family member 6 [Biomphalaria pfeifferi]|uniref:glycerophosphocholine cholinephosphodiesterase n=1 Tax=Biomphalaria pfeifferi TaxID=112525 RepID=A0AAD8CA35_BIOPF|nr:ectonucleotide pyrophosphatase/phosphodiesterase family member 6 [Biomphalaria pfeifferi]
MVRRHTLCFLISVLASALCDKLLVILLDGFRWDYTEKYDLENFKKLYTDGVRAGYLINVFPTFSFPNYYSLMTGLYSETHGITGNVMYDADRNESFILGYNTQSSNPHWWEAGEPVWITSVRQNKSSYMFYWPGCHVPIHGMRPTYCLPSQYRLPLENFRLALHQSLELLDNGTTELAAVYCEQPDLYGHDFGTESREIEEVLKELDQVIGRVMERVLHSGSVNLIIFSDHGMTNMDRSKVINITDVLTSEPNLYIYVYESGAVASIYVPNEVAADKVFDLLENFHPRMKVYRRLDLPQRLHYKYGRYVAEITCVAELGWVILQPMDNLFPNETGTHGYDFREKDMRGIFYAMGPHFKPGASVSYLKAVDMYNLMCLILDLVPSANNGSLYRVKPLLNKISYK